MEEKDSPASPKQSPKSTPTVRVDPRIRKNEETKQENAVMSYAQQMNVLQGSSFYQNLTSNQKVMLNQELSNQNQVGGAQPTSGGGGGNEQVLGGILNALGLMQNQSGGGTGSGINANVLSLLSTISNITQMGGLSANVLQNPNLSAQNMMMPGQQVNPNILGQGNHNNNKIDNNHNYLLKKVLIQSVAQPGLLGAAPGIPNIPPDFQINFDPRNGGLLGNAPPFVNFNNPNQQQQQQPQQLQQPQQQQQQQQQQQPGDNQNFNFASDDFFPLPDNNGPPVGNFNNNRDGRFNRGDNRPPGGRRGRNFNRNNRNNFRNNRNRVNRGHTPP